MYEGITIDPAGSRDRDDAIKVVEDGRHVRVSIAFPDLTKAVVPGSTDDRVAIARGTSRYDKGGLVRPMLDRGITEEASLNPGRKRAVFVLDVVLDESATVLDYRLRRDRFESRRCLSYAEATEAMRSGGDPELALAWKTSQVLHRRRRENGALAYWDLRRGIITTEEGATRQIDVGTAKAEVTIAEMMILANTVLAAHAARGGLPILYRNHRARPAASRTDLMADLEADDPLAAQRRAMVMEAATLEPVNAGHYALNLPAYAWFTSPLRRYADLANQRALAAGLDGVAVPSRT